ncbi:hypothetical protein [Myceligenerans crystallogenes]|uniref:ABC-2 family transporter protein n=1 Tax=Myceligenerans crystallogenes TaxID=316335 RepID=A0ABN2N5G7_9MICO
MKPSLSAQLVSEYRKIMTWRVWWYLVGVLLVVLAGLTALISQIALSSSPFGNGADDAGNASVLFSAPTLVAPMVAITVGILVATRDYRNGTATLTFLGEPRRNRVLASKIVVAAAANILLAALSVIVSAGVAVAFLVAAGEQLWLWSSPVQAKLGWTVIAFMLWSLIGLGIGELVRNQFGALLSAFGYLLAIEPALRMMLGMGNIRLVDFFPGSAGDSLVGGTPMSGMYPRDLQDPVQGGLVLAAFAAIALALGWVRITRSDVP